MNEIFTGAGGFPLKRQLGNNLDEQKLLRGCPQGPTSPQAVYSRRPFFALDHLKAQSRRVPSLGPLAGDRRSEAKSVVGHRATGRTITALPAALLGSRRLERGSRPDRSRRGPGLLSRHVGRSRRPTAQDGPGLVLVLSSLGRNAVPCLVRGKAGDRDNPNAHPQMPTPSSERGTQAR